MSEIANGDRVRLRSTGEVGYVSTISPSGHVRVWVTDRQQYLYFDRDELDHIARYIPGKPTRMPNGDYVYFDTGRFEVLK